MAGRIKNNPSLVPKMQGVTGREEQRLIGDECLEHEEVRSESQDSQEDEEDEEDEDGYLFVKPVEAEEYVIPEEKKKAKTKGGKLGEGVEEEGEAAWSQEQQKSLEHALQQFPKGCAERWERIAAKVEGKGKEQCMHRFKMLAEQVKRKKAEKVE